MAQQTASNPHIAGTKKRKEHPGMANNDTTKRAKFDHRAKQRIARVLSTQTASKAFKNGELDVDKFVRSREYEIRALEEGMMRSKKALTKRAFQQVPKDLRRRTASHNAKRVPKRLQPRAKREMVEDNTPIVTARRRRPTRHIRLRLETAKRLRALGAKGKGVKNQNGVEKQNGARGEDKTVAVRAPRIKKAASAEPSLPKAKFRKRQKSKTWLPTHMYHAKRARMTPPKDPLWRFALPLTPTVKSYRPTHRAANERGAVAWDMSYMSTIALHGQQRSIESLLAAVGVVSSSAADDLAGARGERWTNGTRAAEVIIHERESPHDIIAPATVIWCGPECLTAPEPKKRQRSILVRIHPAAFWQVWEELLRGSKVVKPQVSIEDLRFELGSIEVTGPGATEALHGALLPSSSDQGHPDTTVDAVKTWQLLSGVTNSASLPTNVVLAFEVQDPRLRHPPRTIGPPEDGDFQSKLMQALASWPLDSVLARASLFDRKCRLTASAALPSQKSINRRKSLATPGRYPEALPTDSRIPILLYNSDTKAGLQGRWTVLLPWKCLQPVWYSVMYYPLSTGGQPRFGGLDEHRQLAFEAGRPWFPGDFPATKAGWEWEQHARQKRKAEWERRPKSKRINWDTVDLGNGEKGELGTGWACDWQRLCSTPASDPAIASRTESTDTPKHRQVPRLNHLPLRTAQIMLKATTASDTLAMTGGSLATVRINLLTRGVPLECARIYRLPSEARSGDLRKKWLALHPRNQLRHKQHGSKNALPRLPADAPTHLVQRQLAQALLETPRVGDEHYPACPDEESLIGFVTTGNYNLGAGHGTGIGSIALQRVIEDVSADDEDGRLCVVRNAGNTHGRLATWELV